MHDLIDIYTRQSGRIIYVEGTRMHRTLAAARRHYLALYGAEVVARFAN